MVFIPLRCHLSWAATHEIKLSTSCSRPPPWVHESGARAPADAEHAAEGGPCSAAQAATLPRCGALSCGRLAGLSQPAGGRGGPRLRHSWVRERRREVHGRGQRAQARQRGARQQREVHDGARAQRRAGRQRARLARSHHARLRGRRLPARPVRRRDGLRARCTFGVSAPQGGPHTGASRNMLHSTRLKSALA